MIRIISGKADKIDRAEAMRLIGASDGEKYGCGEILDECERMLVPCLRPKACYEEYPISFYESCGRTVIDLGFTKTESRSLLLNLRGCGKIVLFAATIGAEADRLILKYGKLSPARALVLQAMGAAAAESWCDEVNSLIKREYGGTRPRFSCGYGDFPLEVQRDIFSALNATKNIGITLTEKNLMIPSKSVTAVVGVETAGDMQK